MVTQDFLDQLSQYEEVLTNGQSSTFVVDTYMNRLPAIIRDVAKRNADRLSEDQIYKLHQLATDLSNDAIIPMPSTYGNENILTKHYTDLLNGKNYTWRNSLWFLSEIYMFHLILIITDYYTTRMDPFYPIKIAELEDSTPWNLLEKSIETCANDSFQREVQLQHLMKLCLWGNKADMCYQQVKDTVMGTNATLVVDDEYLLADQSLEVIQHLKHMENTKFNKIQFINDNSGTELLLDLALADHLLSKQWCTSVTLNVKEDPMYVSDATPQDVLMHIQSMQQDGKSETIQALGKRLQNYMKTSQLNIQSSLFWNQYKYYWEFPENLSSQLSHETSLIILKGDLNYRRLIGDRLWPPTTPITTAIPYFPTAFVTFRTLKSDPIIGIDEKDVAWLEEHDKEWRVNGKRGVIQGIFQVK